MCKDNYFCRMKNPVIRFVETTSSTNLEMSEIIKYNKLNNIVMDDFYALYAGYQTQGRGVAGNSWQSEANENILISFYFSVPLHPAKQFAFNQFFSLSVRKMIAQYTPNATIKWPNDIYVDNKKIAGILIEHTWQHDKILHTIAGVGINVNQTHFPSSVPNPVSLKLLTEKEFDIRAVISELMNAGYEYYPYLTCQNFAFLNKEYLQYLYMLNEERYYKIKEEETKAKIAGVNEFEQLVFL